MWAFQRKDTLVVQQGRFDGFRPSGMIQGKAQPAVNGKSFIKAATPNWIIPLAPFGRAGKRSPALLRLLARRNHCRRNAPSGQPLHGLAESIKSTLLDD